MGVLVALRDERRDLRQYVVGRELSVALIADGPPVPRTAPSRSRDPLRGRADPTATRARIDDQMKPYGEHRRIRQLPIKFVTPELGSGRFRQPNAFFGFLRQLRARRADDGDQRKVQLLRKADAAARLAQSGGTERML